MRSLNDPANPYLGQYTEWDQWMCEHAHEPTDEERAAYFDGKLPATWCWNSLAVTHEGYVVPYSVGMEGARRFAANGHQADGSCSMNFQVFADMPAELKQRLDDFDISVYARYVMAIPQWLAASPPLSARIWPDGSVTTHGALGSYRGESDVVQLGADSWTFTDDPYCLYAADGTLLKQTAAGRNEEDLFPGDYRTGNPLDALFFSGWYEKMLRRGHARGWRGLYLNYDYEFWYPRGSREPIEIYDIDGTRYGPGFDMLARDENKFTDSSGDNLPKLYAAQQASAGQP